MKNIRYELYRKSNNTELLSTNPTGTSANRIRVYQDGTLTDDESVHFDGEGREYFQIRNPYTTENGGSFANRPKDAITAIRDGFGDIFVNNSCFGLGTSFETVYRYVDREYGAKAREQTLAAFSNASFEYAIRFGLKAGASAASGDKSGIRYVNKNNMLGTPEILPDTLTFGDEALAEKYKDATLKTVDMNLEKLEQTVNAPSDITKLVDWINSSPFKQGGAYGKGHVVNAVFFAKLQEWQECMTDTYVFEVVQVIKA